MTTIVCMMAIHRRPHVTRETIRFLQGQTVPLEIVLVGDSKIEQGVAEEMGCHYIRHPNSPLGAKHQAGMDYAREFDPDYVMTSASDTWITVNWVEEAIAQLKKSKAQAVGKSRWFAVHLLPDTLEIIERGYAPYRAHEPVGVGRVITRQGLNMLDWQLYPVTRNRGLDGGCLGNLQRAGCKIEIMNNIRSTATLGIKGPWQTITTWEKVSAPRRLVCYPGPVDPEQWLEVHYLGSLEAITRLREAHWPKQKRSAIKQRQSCQTQSQLVNMVKLRYVGHNQATTVFWGMVTGTRYEFGLQRPIGYVYDVDALALLVARRRCGRQGLLPLFERVDQ